MRPPLELHAIEIQKLRKASMTRWLGSGRLDVDVLSLARLAADPAIADVTVELVGPGEPIRLVNVLDVVEPATKADDRESSFPGIIGDIRRAGVGRTVRLEGAAIVALADLDQTHPEEVRAHHLDGDSVIDMSGSAAHCTHWSGTHNIVMNFSAAPESSLRAVDNAIRRGMLAAAEEIAAAVASLVPDRIDIIDLHDAGNDLPSVCLILLVGSEGPLQDTILYGRPLEGIMPILVEPAELLDGALINGAFDWAGVRNSSYFYQRNALAIELIQQHGVTLNFSGAVLTLAYLSSAKEKARSAMQAANLAEQLGADGALISGYASGNSQTDLMLVIRACEKAGIRTVGLAAETNGGLTDHLPEADCLVSVGNKEEFVHGWAPRRVIGGAMRTGRDGHTAEPLPLISYVGSTSQLGNTRFKAVWR